jgi:altronate hydrolase
MNTEIPTLTIRLHSSDNVVVALIDLAAGTAIPSEGLTTCLHVPAGHKIATVAIHSGQPVKKYSQLIGLGTSDILPGEWVHSHNMALKTYPREYSVGAGANPIDYIPEKSRATFNGIVRPDGRIPHSLSSFLLPW